MSTLIRSIMLATTATAAIATQAQAPPWVWADPFGRALVGAATMDAGHNNYYCVSFTNEAMSPCGTAYTSNGSGWYITSSGPADQCLWSVQVPAHPGQLRLDGADLHFDRWCDTPVQIGATFFDPGNGTCYVTGRVDPIQGYVDEALLTCAHYQLYGAPSTRVLRQNDHVLMAVCFTDSVRLGSTLLTTTDSLTVIAEFSTDGELAWLDTVASGPIVPSAISEDSAGRILLGGACTGCVVNGTDVIAPPAEFGLSASFVACVSALGDPVWLWQNGLGYTAESGPSVLVGNDDRVLIGYLTFDPFDQTYVGLAELLASDGQSSAAIELALGHGTARVPQLAQDVDGGYVVYGMYVGANPDQMLVKTDADLNEVWRLDLDQGSNFWEMVVKPVALNSYLVTGGHEFGLQLGSHNLLWVGGFLNGFIAKLSDSTLGLTPSMTPGTGLGPNPVRDELCLRSSASGTMSMFDASGRCVMRQRISSGTNSIDVSRLASGPYAVHSPGDIDRFIKE